MAAPWDLHTLVGFGCICININNNNIDYSALKLLLNLCDTSLSYYYLTSFGQLELIVGLFRLFLGKIWRKKLILEA